MGTHVIIIYGRIGRGFKVIGLFDNFDDTKAFARKHLTGQVWEAQIMEEKNYEYPARKLEAL